MLPQLIYYFTIFYPFILVIYFQFTLFAYGTDPVLHICS